MNRKFSLLAAALAVGTLAALPALAASTTPASPATSEVHHVTKAKHHAKVAKAKTGPKKPADKTKGTMKKSD
ncbi:MAG TPA: hypothetical protein VMU87_04595 [Stellaceae bacterium]|nr:hypothetical protein [Stellaceae bacterium]